MRTKIEPKQIKMALTACEQFEVDLNSFVDGELPALDASRVSQHIDQCQGCCSFVNGLAGLAGLHRDLDGDLDADAAIEMLGAGELWSDLVRRLVSDTEERLISVLYELGKALIIAGHSSTPRLRQHNMFQKRPGSIRSLSKKGRVLAREIGELRSRMGQDRRDHRRGDLRTSDLRTSDLRRGGLFPASDESLRGGMAFEAGRACLEQCLRLDPGSRHSDCHNARIFLAHYHKTVGRLDRARKQLRVVLRSDADRRTKMIAYHQMARIYCAARQFSRAIEVERSVLEEATRKKDEWFQVIALTNLTIYSVKLDRLEEAEASISRLVNEFPGRLKEAVVPAFRKAREFKRALARNAEFLNGLRKRYPMLFAS